MFRPIDYVLDRITMYRLLLYYLIILVVIATGLSAFNILNYNPLAVIGSAGYITAICWISNQIFGSVFEVPTNVESVYITALILALIITPLHTPHDILFLTAAGGLAMASKYILAIGRKHIFNPAAIAVVLTAWGAGQSASWWIGSSAMLPYVVVGGLLIVRKIHHGKMVASFLGAVTFSTVLVNVIAHAGVTSSLSKTVLHSSLFFLAFVMLTEPLTSPATENKQLWFAVLIGLLFPPQVHIVSLYFTPELALVMGNIYAFVVSPKVKLMPKLTHKEVIASGVMDFVFDLKKPIGYKPGQYMGWTLGHKDPDTRGNRRYFTLASSPTEHNLRLGVKFYTNGSSYKKAMLAMENGVPMAATQLGGDFVMPDNPAQKLAFIAGGIGVTPYRSMVKYLLDTNQRRNITLLYSEKQPQNFAYWQVFNEAYERFGAHIIYTITDQASVPRDWRGQTGTISGDMIKANVPDYAERLFYLSGPHSMVTAVKEELRGLGVPNRQIKTDFFPGYA